MDKILQQASQKTVKIERKAPNHHREHHGRGQRQSKNLNQ
jgi:hypothetical protein